MHQLVTSIQENPTEWHVSKYHFYHTQTGVTLWISNGFLGFNLDSGGKLSFTDKVQVWLAYKRWVKNATAEMLGA